MPDGPKHLQTRLATAGCEPDPVTGAITPSIHTATTFERALDGTYPGGFVYSREGNPSRLALERALAVAEGAGEAAAFSSGMAAAGAVITAVCAGGHVLLPTDVYHGVRHVADTVWRPWGLDVTAVDYTTDWESAIQDNTCLIWMETPSNPLVRITDIRAVANVGRRRGILTLVDATWCTPLITRPIDLGADLVLHSTTKYLGGHSDVLGGVVLARPGLPAFAKIRHVQYLGGAVMDPFSAWLTLRGMRSLAARMQVQCDSAERLAGLLEGHDRVTRVHYPGLDAHPGHAVARSQMARFGAMMSFEVGGGRSEAMAVAGALRIFRRATSLGGTESLIEHRASIEPDPPTSPEGLLRISVGLEHPADLEADLRQALDS